MKITKRQKNILLIGWEKGILHHKDFVAEYTDKKSMQNCISRFLILGFLKQTYYDYFEVNRELIQKELKLTEDLSIEN